MFIYQFDDLPSGLKSWNESVVWLERQIDFSKKPFLAHTVTNHKGYQCEENPECPRDKEMNLPWVFRKMYKGSLTTPTTTKLGTVDIIQGCNGTLSPALSHCSQSTSGSMI